MIWRIFLGLASLAMFGAMMYGVKVFLHYMADGRPEFTWGALFGGGFILICFWLAHYLEHRQR